MYQYSKEDIQIRTALTIDFINHASSKLADILDRFRIRSDKGKILYNDDGLQIWDTITHRRGRGDNIKQIRDSLEAIVSPDPQPNKAPSEPSQTNPQSSTTPVDLNAIISAMADSYERGVNSERSRVLMLTEAAEVQKKREAEHIKKIAYFQAATNSRADLLSQLEKVSGFGKKKKRKGILEQIRRIDLDALNAPVSDQTNSAGKPTAE